jgi:AhpD family alkylhydroperoxidase
MKDYRAHSAATLREAIPEGMRGFTHFGRAAYGEGALPPKFRELIALATAISQHREDRVANHARRVAKLGTTRAAVIETIAVAVQLGRGPSMIVGGQALEAFDSFQGTTSAPTQEKHHAHFQS